MYEEYIDKAVFLAWFTIIYNIIEGIISISFGISEGSIALAGFGADSLIEFASGGFVLWRFSHKTRVSQYLSKKREIQSTKGIGFLFIILAIFMFITSGYNLLNGFAPETTIPGVIISLISLLVMFFLYEAKVKAGNHLNSSTVLKDADCTMACIKLSAILFVGSIIYELNNNLWWADSVASMLLGVFIFQEGLYTVRSNDCSC